MNSNNNDSVQTLHLKAAQLESSKDYEGAWLVRQDLRKVAPNDLDNLLSLIQLAIHLKNLADHESLVFQLVDHLDSSEEDPNIDYNLLELIIVYLLEAAPASEIAINLSEIYLKYIDKLPSLSEILLQKIAGFLNEDILPKPVVLRYNKIAFNLQPDNISFLVKLINLNQDLGHYAESCNLAELFISISETLLDRITAYYLMIRGLMKSGHQFHLAHEFHNKLTELQSSLILSDIEINANHIYNLIVTNSFFSYFEDNPQKNNFLKNKFSYFWQLKLKEIIDQNQCLPKRQNQRNHKEPNLLKIGYLSSCFRRHSVGSLTRWLFHYHNHNQFQIYAYSLNNTNDYIQNYIQHNVDNFADCSNQEATEIYELILEDEIDILVDLDGLTYTKSCVILALKPAPIQVSWLGFDASGLPAIDYFVADPYVLPSSAQNYYSEKIWHLPQTYIAVDGFEVDVPSLRRDELGIPENAIVYFSSQSGYKRNPDNARSQMRILKNVPNSYFLVKGFSNSSEEGLKSFFEEIAEAEGVSSDRLRFLPEVDREEIHRANLGIADVVLDTYPYTGATTTLETLWMGIPIVTRVGEQFSARNSYTMLMNVGVTEGIAWTDEEYVEWGIRLGKDAALRQQINWKMLQSRQTSPLWNTRKFAREMEKAYQQMWENYVTNNK